MGKWVLFCSTVSIKRVNVIKYVPIKLFEFNDILLYKKKKNNVLRTTFVGSCIQFLKLKIILSTII